jgi:hypothetical protein
MPTYVVATRQEAQTGSLTAEDHVREVPGVWIRVEPILIASLWRRQSSQRPRSSVGSEVCS